MSKIDKEFIVQEDLIKIVENEVLEISNIYVAKYIGKDREQVQFDLENNHNSLREILAIEKKLGRPINMSEIMYYVNKRNEHVLNKCK